MSILNEGYFFIPSYHGLGGLHLSYKDSSWTTFEDKVKAGIISSCMKPQGRLERIAELVFQKLKPMLSDQRKSPGPYPPIVVQQPSTITIIPKLKIREQSLVKANQYVDDDIDDMYWNGEPVQELPG